MIWHLVYWWWSCHHLVIYQYRVDITFKQEIKANLGHDNSSQLKTVTSSLPNQRNKFKVFAISMQSSALHAACLPAAVVCCTRLPWCGARHRLSVSCPGRQPLLTRSWCHPASARRLSRVWGESSVTMGHRHIGHVLSLDPIKCVNFIIRQRLGVCTSG